MQEEYVWWRIEDLRTGVIALGMEERDFWEYMADARLRDMKTKVTWHPTKEAAYAG